MVLKDIFTMVKADKYTADGREELIKAQEAEVEDKVYQIGEISQKTGLQKTANGWVKPKSGKAAGTKASNTPESKPSGAAEGKKENKPSEESGNSGKGSDEVKSGPEWIKSINKEFKDIIAKNPKLQQYLNTGRTGRLSVPGEGTYLGEEALARVKEIQKENFEKERRGERTTPYKLSNIELDEQTARDLIGNYMEDSAPRILTGDTKIRVRK